MLGWNDGCTILGCSMLVEACLLNSDDIQSQEIEVVCIKKEWIRSKRLIMIKIMMMLQSSLVPQAHIRRYAGLKRGPLPDRIIHRPGRFSRSTFFFSVFSVGSWISLLLSFTTVHTILIKNRIMATSQPPVRFTSHKNFVWRLVFSVLTGRTIQISQIRPSSTNPGLAPHEISFLRLIESVTNGSQMEISYTGTILVFKPGLITGSAPGNGASGGVIHHQLPPNCSRGVSYFLVPLCLLAPFSKAPIRVLFSGPGVITSSTPTGDMSVDSVRTAILPLYNQFGIFNNIELRVLRRSNPGTNGKGGGGEVQLVFGHQVRLAKTLHMLNPGRIKRIRGVAYSVGTSGSNNARMIETARGILNPLSPDTYIFSDMSSAPLVDAPDKTNPSAKKKIGLGFGLSLVAESSTGCLYSADVACPPSGGQPPEDIGKQCAYQLLETISKGGCVAPAAAPTMLGLMTMGTEDVGRLQLGREVVGDEGVIQLARDLTKFGCPGWGLRDASDDNSTADVIVSVVGRGIGNVGRKVA